jgi:uncharacterized protein (DUF427 family)
VLTQLPFYLASTTVTHPQSYKRNLTMVTVTVNGRVIAKSDNTVLVEGNHYFPPESFDKDLFSQSTTRYCPLSPRPYTCLILSSRIRSTVCPWKGFVFLFDPTVIR